MTLYEGLLANYRSHIKSRMQKHKFYPERFYVPDEMVSWQQNFPEYQPVNFNAPIVLDPATPWADPADINKITHPFTSFMGEVQFDKEGIPKNPVGRTGLCGRGVLGKWGANFAVDAIITTVNPDTNQLLVLTITRSDTGESAFPGGMIDEGEDALQARDRELEEELSLQKKDMENPVYEQIVSKGYVGDPRNTDNAWLETTAIHTHLSHEIAQNLNLHAGDDASGYRWIEITPENIRSFYASHGLTLILAMKEFIETGSSFLKNEVKDYLNKITTNTISPKNENYSN